MDQETADAWSTLILTGTQAGIAIDAALENKQNTLYPTSAGIAVTPSVSQESGLLILISIVAIAAVLILKK